MISVGWWTPFSKLLKQCVQCGTIDWSEGLGLKVLKVLEIVEGDLWTVVVFSGNLAMKSQSWQFRFRRTEQTELGLNKNEYKSSSIITIAWCIIVKCVFLPKMSTVHILRTCNKVKITCYFPPLQIIVLYVGVISFKVICWENCRRNLFLFQIMIINFFGWKQVWLWPHASLCLIKMQRSSPMINHNLERFL